MGKLVGRLLTILRRVTPAVAWDALMVYLAFLNLFVLAFDVSYFWLRSVYLETVPVVARLYDPIKGIEPEPVIQAYLETVDRLEAAGDLHSRELLVADLRAQSVDVTASSLFLRSGQAREMRMLDNRLRQWVASGNGSRGSAAGAAGSLSVLWSAGADEEQHLARLSFFDDELKPLFSAIHLREISRTGEFADWGWLVDLPFLLIFTIEFYGRWAVAIRRRTYARWFMFPIFHWYDFLGIIPLPQFRIFRLFRIVAIYVRLQKSSRSNVGDDLVSRTVRYFANIINEEISDMVSLRILSETQAEIQDGTHRRIIADVLPRRRDAIARELADLLRGALHDPDLQQTLSELVDANLGQAADTKRLRSLPLPRSVIHLLVTEIGAAVYESVIEAAGQAIDSEEGRASLERLICDGLDGLVTELTEGEAEVFVRELLLETIEHIKDAVKVRKWALPEAPGPADAPRQFGP